MNKQAGFTLIELVAVMVILALLGAMAVPRFADVQTSALRAAQDGSSNAVKSAHSIAIAENKTLPNITTLATYVGGQGGTATAANGGVVVSISGNNFTVPTYTDSTCASLTTAPADIVACVGNIP